MLGPEQFEGQCHRDTTKVVFGHERRVVVTFRRSSTKQAEQTWAKAVARWHLFESAECGGRRDLWVALATFR